MTALHTSSSSSSSSLLVAPCHIMLCDVLRMLSTCLWQQHLWHTNSVAQRSTALRSLIQCYARITPIAAYRPDWIRAMQFISLFALYRPCRNNPCCPCFSVARMEYTVKNSLKCYWIEGGSLYGLRLPYLSHRLFSSRREPDSLSGFAHPAFPVYAWHYPYCSLWKYTQSC